MRPRENEFIGSSSKIMMYHIIKDMKKRISQQITQLFCYLTLNKLQNATESRNVTVPCLVNLVYCHVHSSMVIDSAR